MTYHYQSPLIPKSFIWRRAHSLTGLWLVLFLIEHLLTNSQAALLIGDDGNGFVKAVNWIKGLPYLPFIEVALLGVPLIIHGIWGIRYLWQARYNIQASDGSRPVLSQYSRNQAYTWQRITSWILLLGIIAHVIHMRFIEYPVSAQLGSQHYYFVKLKKDNGLYTLSKRLDFDLYSVSQIQEMTQKILSHLGPLKANEETPEQLIAAQKNREEKAWIEALNHLKINESQLVAVSKSFGMAELLIVRDSFKSPSLILFYTGFVIAACFHAFNGLWTFMISWGITLTVRSQNLMRKLAIFIMLMITFLGLSAIWGTYWLNLTH
jgi:succinate dehydrogenase / fumarate reductase cytochrome b subunit